MDEVRAAAHRRTAAEGASNADVEAWEQMAIEKLLAEFGLPAMPVRRKSRDEDGTKEPGSDPVDDIDDEGDDR